MSKNHYIKLESFPQPKRFDLLKAYTSLQACATENLDGWLTVKSRGLLFIVNLKTLDVYVKSYKPKILGN